MTSFPLNRRQTRACGNTLSWGKKKKSNSLFLKEQQPLVCVWKPSLQPFLKLPFDQKQMRKDIVNGCQVSVKDVDIRGYDVHGQACLHSKFKASLGYMQAAQTQQVKANFKKLNRPGGDGALL